MSLFNVAVKEENLGAKYRDFSSCDIADARTFLALTAVDNGRVLSSENASIVINETLTDPLVISMSVSKKCDVVVKSRVRAHVMLDLSASSELIFTLKENSSLSLYLLTNSSKPMAIITKANLAKSAHLRVFEFGLYDDKSHRSFHIELLGEAASVAYFGADQLHKDADKRSFLHIAHRAQNTESLQTFRGAYADSSASVFLGKVTVDKNAPKSSARQLYKTIILHDGAKAHVMPQLEINNNDIAASHGASIGELDENALFYLCSRGLSMSDAKTMLVKSLLEDILDQIDEPKIKNIFSPLVEKSIERSLERKL